ncbi:ankyrin repeat-containing domain protein [Aspergillus heterothallicus]
MAENFYPLPPELLCQIIDYLPTTSRASLLHALPLLRATVSQSIILSRSQTDDRTTLLHTLSINGDAKLLAALLASHPSMPCTILDKSNRTPISLACEAGHLNIVKLLCGSKDAKPDAHDHRDSRFPRRTPLSWAAGAGHLDIVKYLIENNLSVPDKADSWARTPLLWAVKGGHVPVVRYLVEQENTFGYLDGEDPSPEDPDPDPDPPAIPFCDLVGINRDDEDGITPLLCAVQARNPEIVGILLRRMDLNVNRRFGMSWGTALSFAAELGDVEIVRLLVARDDVDVNIRDRDGLTAIARARARGHFAIVARLQSRARQWRGLNREEGTDTVDR